MQQNSSTTALARKLKPEIVNVDHILAMLSILDKRDDKLFIFSNFYAWNVVQLKV